MGSVSVQPRAQGPGHHAGACYFKWREGREAEREQKSHPEGENEYKSDGSKSGFSREVKMRWPAV